MDTGKKDNSMIDDKFKIYGLFAEGSSFHCFIGKGKVGWAYLPNSFDSVWENVDLCVLQGV